MIVEIPRRREISVCAPQVAEKNVSLRVAPQRTEHRVFVRTLFFVWQSHFSQNRRINTRKN